MSVYKNYLSSIPFEARANCSSNTLSITSVTIELSSDFHLKRLSLLATATTLKNIYNNILRNNIDFYKYIEEQSTVLHIT